MAFQSSPVLDFSFEAAEDLSSYQYHFVTVDSDGKAALLDSATEVPIGVLQNAPESGEEATVRILGISKVKANAALDEYTFIAPEYVSGTDCGKASDGSYGSIVCGQVLGATSAEDDLASVLLFHKGHSALAKTVTTDATAGASTYTAAEVLGGLILRDPSGDNRSDVTPTAALLIAEMAKYGISDFEFTIQNTADATETITVTEGTGVTLTGTMTIAQNYARRFLCVKTSSTTVTIYSIASVAN